MRCKNYHSRSGLVVVELALTLPILFFLLFASYELSRANLLRHAARASAYEGARVGILPGANSDQVKSAVRFTLASIGVREAKITVTPNDIKARSTTIRVDVNIEAKKNFFFAPFFFRDGEFSGDCELSREVF